MPDAADCPFCARIAAHEFDYFDTHSVAFRPLNPVTPGHFLVVPRKHVTHALEGPDHAGRALKLAGYLANQMGLLSANFITSAGSAATQSVPHLHVHVVPRREGDGLALPWTGQRDQDGHRKALEHILGHVENDNAMLAGLLAAQESDQLTAESEALLVIRADAREALEDPRA